MNFSHILITRPQQEAAELADLLAPLPAELIILPAYTFLASKLFPDQIGQLQRAVAQTPQTLLIFTSPRSVEFGLSQVPPEVVRGARVAAIGPSTSVLLERAGVAVNIRPQQGYYSEDLIKALALAPLADEPAPVAAFILAAPGGRTLIKEGLQVLGYSVHTLMVYENKPAALDVAAVSKIDQARCILALWTSANAMTSLFQRLPAHCWHQLCQGEWMVISDRLMRIARAYNPAKIHTTLGPANEDIAAAVRALF